ncbi:MAG: glycosyltransferase family 1 protein [Chthonomonadales bacterium]|nr:glycosyltransferase family 1 protein [Chthonomonadales bacterium]
MKIALFASRFYPHVGGVEELVRQLAHQERLRNEMPLIVTNRWPKDLPAVEVFEGIPLRRYNFRVPDRTWRQMGGAILFGPSTLWAICNAIKAHGADLLHVQCVSSNAYYALWAKKVLRRPLVISLQGELTMDAAQVFQKSLFAQSLMRRALAEADAVTACSAQTLRDAEEFYGKSLGDRARVIMNGVTLSDFAQGETYQHPRPYILGIGRLVPQKGFDVLVRAYAQSGITSHDLMLVGEGSEEAELKRLVAELGLTGRVFMPGRADRAGAVAYFNGCSFFVLPSRMEPMGIVLFEAMAAGKAIIASDVGGVPENVRHEQTGLLVPGDDVKALSLALCRLDSDPALRERLANAGNRYVQDYDWAKIAEQYAEVYRAVLE